VCVCIRVVLFIHVYEHATRHTRLPRPRWIDRSARFHIAFVHRVPVELVYMSAGIRHRPIISYPSRYKNNGARLRRRPIRKNNVSTHVSYLLINTLAHAPVRAHAHTHIRHLANCIYVSIIHCYVYL